MTLARLGGVDALRAAAAVAVVSIHVTLGPDSYRTEFWAALGFRDRFLNFFGDLLSRFAVASFVATSFYLLSRSLSGRPEPYETVVRKRFARVLPAYLFWSALYMLIESTRAWHGGRDGFGWMADPAAWARAILGGVSPNMYHLWFIPMLLALTALYPLPRALGRGLLAVPAATLLLAIWYWLDQHPWEPVVTSRLKDFWWRGTAVLGYAAFAVLGVAAERALAAGISPGARRAVLGLGAALLAASLGVFIRDAAAQARTVDVLPLGPLSFAALYAYPAGVITLFVFSERLAAAELPPRLLRLAEVSFGIYLAHPLVLMLFDPIERRGLNTAANGLIVAKLAITVALSWALTELMMKSERLKRFVS